MYNLGLLLYKLHTIYEYFMTFIDHAGGPRLRSGARGDEDGGLWEFHSSPQRSSTQTKIPRETRTVLPLRTTRH